MFQSSYFNESKKMLVQLNKEKYPSKNDQKIVMCNAKVKVTKNPVATSFSYWTHPRHFSRTLVKGPKSTTWIWNLHDLGGEIEFLVTILKGTFCQLYVIVI